MVPAAPPLVVSVAASAEVWHSVMAGWAVGVGVALAAAAGDVLVAGEALIVAVGAGVMVLLVGWRLFA